MTHIRTLFGVCALICLSLLASCSNDDRQGQQNESSGKLMLALSVDGMSTEIATRVTVDEEAGESTVNSIHLFFFESSSDRSGAFVGYIEQDNPSATGTTELSTLGTSINISESYQVIGVANLSSSYLNGVNTDTWIAGFSGQTEAYFRNRAMATLQSSSNLSSNALLMSGSTTKSAADGLISLTLTRNVARFDVINNLTGYNLVRAALYNVYPSSSITGDVSPDYSSATSRMNLASYTLSASESNVKGKLYAFENQVNSPAQGDAVTTCLIIGLQPTAGGNTEYHRVNIVPEESTQYIKRNNVYQVTLSGVKSTGYDNEANAYAGTEDRLSYTINNWDLGENGIVVSDTYSLLAAPVKTIQFDYDGDTKTYAITTYSTLENPGSLTIKSSNLPDGMTAVISGTNNLVVYAPANEADESGSITLSFAGLEATIDVVRTKNIENYLKLTYAADWSSVFGPTAGQQSKVITVDASGSWSAEVIGEGFAFSSDYGTSFVSTISSTDPIGNFTVWTSSENTNRYDVRNAFVIVSLDSDPINYAAVVTLRQQVSSAIDISPAVETITFDGGGNALTTNTFSISSTSGGLSTTVSDNTLFTATISGATLTVTANTINTSVTNLTGTVTITDSSNGVLTINLVQRPITLSLVPDVTTIDAKGGDVTFTINSGGVSLSGFTYDVSVTSNGVSKDVVNHTITSSKSIGNDIAAPTFVVTYPKIYYPNRETDIRSVITVTLSTGATMSYTLTQSALTANALNVWASSSGYGTVGYRNSYFASFYDAFQTYSPTIKATSTSLTSSYSMLNFNAQDANVLYRSSYDWSSINSWRTNTDGVIFATMDERVTNARNNMNSTNSPFNAAGFNVENNSSNGSYSSSNGAVLNTSSNTDTRVYQFIMEHATNNLSGVSMTQYFVSDVVRSELTAWPDNSTVLLWVSNAVGTRALLVIDPANRLVFLGEGQVFGQAANVTGNRNLFMVNVIDYLVLTAKYGSHFSDMLIDDSSIPEPWNSVWGANAMD